MKGFNFSRLVWVLPIFILGACKPGLHFKSLSESLIEDVPAGPSHGNGTFVLSHDEAVGSGAYHLVSGDFNGDGKLDIATSNFNDGTVSILYGNGDGTLQTQLNYVVGAASEPFGIEKADFNNDGDLDLVVSKWGGNIRVLMNNGDGTFTVGSDVLMSSGVGDVYTIISRDFNNDGNADVVIANCWSMMISVLLGNGDGTFMPYVEYGVGGGAVGMAVGDVNNDSALDIVVTQIGSGFVVLTGVGDGTFNAFGATYPDVAWAETLTLGDLNADGNLDVVATNGFGADLAVMLGNGDATFQSPVGYALSGTGKNVVIHDFNSDGKLDIATATWAGVGGNLDILLGNGDGTLQAPQSTNISSSFHWLVSGDFNGDSIEDLVISDLSTNSMKVMTGL